MKGIADKALLLVSRVYHVKILVQSFSKKTKSVIMMVS